MAYCLWGLAGLITFWIQYEMSRPWIAPSYWRAGIMYMIDGGLIAGLALASDATAWWHLPLLFVTPLFFHGGVIAMITYFATFALVVIGLVLLTIHFFHEPDDDDDFPEDDLPDVPPPWDWERFYDDLQRYRQRIPTPC